MASGVAGAGRDDQVTDKADAVAGRGMVHDAEGAHEASERPGRDYPATEELEHEGKWWERGLLVEELRELTTMALPVVVTYAAQHCLILVLFAFVGRSGEGEEGLAVAGLASMFANFSGISIVVGLSSGLETLASQAYGQPISLVKRLHRLCAFVRAISHLWRVPGSGGTRGLDGSARRRQGQASSGSWES
jgi:hypothetical protein